MRPDKIQTICFAFAVCASFLIGGDVLAATIGKPVSNLGLVGYWSFDEGAGTVAHDLSGRGNNGAVANGMQWSLGKRGKAVQGDGIDDVVSIPDPANGSLDFGASTDFTLSAWVKSSDLSNTPFIIDKRRTFGGAASGYTLQLSSVGLPSLRIADGTNVASYGPSTGSYADGKWHHYVVSAKRVGTTRFYVDGVEVATADISSIGNITRALDLYIGSKDLTSTNTLNGSVDDVRIYNRAISAAEATGLYSSGQSSNLAATKTGLVGHWSMNEGSGTIVHDQSGNGRNGSLSNADSSTAWIAGKKGKSLDFDGVDDYVGIPWSLNLPAGTISIWMRSNSNFGATRVFFEGNGTQVASSPSFEGSGTSVNFYVANGCAKSVGYTQGQWTHFVGTWDGVNSALYKDGRLVSSSACANTESGFTQFNLGARGGGLAADVTLDDARIYNRALTAAEVASLYASTETTVNQSQNSRITDGLVAFWTFNGQDVADAGSQNFDRTAEFSSAGSCPIGWTCVGDAETASSSDGQGCVIATSLEGTRYIKAGCDMTVGTSTSPIFVIPANASKVAFLRAGGADASNGSGLFVRRASDDALICASQTGTDTDAFFADECTGLASYVGTKAYIQIADNQVSGWGKTYVDNIRIQDGSNNDISFGIRALDVIGSGGYAPVFGPFPVSGKVGQALSFDGTNDYIRQGSDLGFRGDVTLSVSAWFRPRGANSGNFPAIVDFQSQTGSCTGLYFTIKDNRPSIDFGSNRWRTTSALSQNRWYHIVVTKTPGLVSATSKIYIDGVEAASGLEAADCTPNVSAPGAGGLAIGRLTHTAEYVAGDIDEVRVYNRVLSANEAKQLYNMGR
ncbi:MAG: LamG domain-containing protein [Candidatus Taylorbacteria bacterium]|nr:LamG domain-containing protein [Candidatus Taylorbacteria bacterium]